MSNAALKTTAKILTHRPMGSNKKPGTNQAVADDEGRDDYEKAYRNHGRKASRGNRQDSPGFSRWLVRALRHEGANGNRGRRVTHRPGDAAHGLSLGRSRAASFHRIAGRVAPDLSQIARLSRSEQKNTSRRRKITSPQDFRFEGKGDKRDDY